jgi:serine protease Do
MNTNRQLAAILLGAIATPALIASYAPNASALTGRQINDVAREVTALIHGENGSHGSGTIISKSNQSYYVLTAHHVVKTNTAYKLVAPDRNTYKLDPQKIVVLPGVDLAVVEFTSDKNYAVAKIAPANTSQGQEVFVSGWPSLGAVGNASGGELIRQFTDGRISGYLPRDYRGYKMIYTNITRAGMSGGGVFDAGGRLVGVHGLGEREDVQNLIAGGVAEQAANTIAATVKPGFNYAIPIGTFLSKAAAANLYLSLQVDRAVAPELGEPYVATAKVDERDRISDFRRTLNTVNEVTGTVRDTQRTINDVRNIIRSPF